MSISMLKQNIELLAEVSKRFQELLSRGDINISGAEIKKIKENLETFKNYIKFLTANIEQLIREEEGNLIL